MRKLNSAEQKSLRGGGPCGKKACSEYPFPGAIYTGVCTNTFGCISPYVQFFTCPSGPGGDLIVTYCSNPY